MKTDKDGKWIRKLRKRIKVKKTIVGRGVFARRAIAADAVIGEITGKIMGTDFESNYCMDLDGQAVLEPASPFRFLNHSCDPNCQLVLWKRHKVNGHKIRRLWLQARRDVAAGEELTIDYAWPEEAAVPCRCGAAGCRGWVVEERASQKLRRMLRRKHTQK